MELLERAAHEGRIVITIDTDFGELVFRQRMPHAGLVRLPDVPGAKRVELTNELLDRYSTEMEQGPSLLSAAGGYASREVRTCQARIDTASAY